MDVDDLVQLPAGPRAAGLARSVVRERLRAWDRDWLLDAVELLTSELVTNVLVHTLSAPSLGVVQVGSGVRVTVVDASPVGPVRRRHSTAATTGRGVQLLDDLADEWGWQALGGGKAVWFTVTGQRDPWAAVGAGWLDEVGS